MMHVQTLVLVSFLCQVSIYVRSVNIDLMYGDNGSNVLDTALSYLDENGVPVPRDLTIKDIHLPADNLTRLLHTVCDEVGNTDAFVIVADCFSLSVLEATVAHLDVPIMGINTDPCPQQLAITSIVRKETAATPVYDAIIAILQIGGFTQAAILTDQSEKHISRFRSALSAFFHESSVTYLPKSGLESARAVTSWLSGVTKTDAANTCLVLMLGQPSLNALSEHLSVSDVSVGERVVIVVSDVTSSLGLKGLSDFHDVLWLTDTLFYSNRSSESTGLKILDLNIGESFRILFEAVASVTMATASPSTISQQCGDRQINVSATASLLKDRLNKMTMNVTNLDNNDIHSKDQYHVLKLEFENQTLTPEYVASWSTQKGLRLLEGQQLFRESTKGLGNITLRVGASVAAPFMIKLPNNTGWEGFCVDILDELAARLNFRYEIIQSPDKMWGTVDEDGNWNGVVEMVRTKDVDMGIGPISLTSERAKVIDYTKPYMEEGAGIILQRFEDKTSKMFRMFKPFSQNVWLTVAAAVLVVGFTLAIVNRLSPEDKKERRTERISTSDNIWVVYESYMEQGAETSPPNISGRFILGFWWIFTILMVASYKANLVAFLTVSFIGKPINTIQDLADQENIIPLVKQGSNLYQELKKGESATFRKLWSMMQNAPLVTTSDEALKHVLTGGYAFLSDKSQIEFLRTRDCETLMSAETPFNVGSIGFIVPESSSLLEMLSINIIQLQEAGLTRKWRQRWWPPSDMCPKQTTSSNVKSLELESTGGSFLVFAGSTAIALLCLVAECIWWKCRGCGKKDRQDADDPRS